MVGNENILTEKKKKRADIIDLLMHKSVLFNLDKGNCKRRTANLADKIQRTTT